MRLCSKTACSGAAVVSCGFNYAERLVWLSPLRRDPDPTFYDLCEGHAETLRAPKGWLLRDQRAATHESQGSLLG